MTNNIAIIAVTEKGVMLGSKLVEEINADFFIPKKINFSFKSNLKTYDDLKNVYEFLFHNYSSIVAIMAQGIVTRMISPYIKSKYIDPAIVTCDEVGRYAISTLSGHEGGANLLAHLVSSVTGAQPVITTATEANRQYVVGVGCRKGTTKDEIEKAVVDACKQVSISVGEIRLIASAWIKKEEKGLIAASKSLGLYLRFIPKQYYLNTYYFFEKHNIPMKYFEIPGVAEPSAVIAATNPVPVLKRTIIGNVTVSIVKENLTF
jgi:cobalt-precorrin 5A hydrolase